MKRRHGIKRYGAVLLVSLLLSTTAGAFTRPPPPVDVAGIDAFRAWYGNGGSCTLTAELVVADTLHLNAEKGGDINGQDYAIRVLSGGHLIVDTVNTTIFGVHADESPLIYVEAGGSLTMTQGQLFGIWGDYTAKTIVLESGATLNWGEDFHVEGGVWIGDARQSKPGTEPPTEPEPEPSPEPSPESSPITDLWGEVRKVQGGKVRFYMTLPRLEMKAVAAIRVERSADGEQWEERDVFLWNEDRGYLDAGVDSSASIQFGVEHTYISYVETTDYQDFYLRLYVEGTPYKGFSNAVKVEIPANARPGEDVKPPITGDYEDNEGNRGGGGQGESEREKPEITPQPTPEPTSAPIPEPIPEQTPEQIVPPPQAEAIAPITPSDTPMPSPAPSPARDTVASVKRPSPSQMPPAPEQSPTNTAPTQQPEISPRPSPPQEPSPTAQPAQPTATPAAEDTGAGDQPPISTGTAAVAVATAVAVVGLGTAAYFIRKRKP